MTNALIPLLIIIPLATAVVIALSHSLPRRLFDVLAAGAALALAVLSALLLREVAAKGVLTHAVGGWPHPLGITLVADGLSVFLLMTVNALAFLLVLYSAEYMEKYTGKWKYYVFFMLMLTGLNGTLLSSDLFNVFVFVEMTVIAAYLLASFNREAENFEASFKYAVLGTLSSMLILLAIALIYAKTSALSYAGISLALGEGKSPFSALILLLLIAGFGLKATLVPFHAWVPDAYSSAPSPVSAAYAGALSKVLGVYMLLRLLYNVIGVTALSLNLLALLGIVSILAGVTLALYQWDLKRLLAYHSISQIGYIMLGVGLGTPLGILGGLFHLVNHSAFKSLLFLNAGSLEHTTGTRDLKELGGLSKRLPVTAATSMIASLSISGVPPLNGFWSKLLIVLACVSAGRHYLAFFAALAGILTLSSFLKVQRYAFYGFLREGLSNVREAPLLMTIPMIVLALCCVFMGILLLPGIDNSFLGLALNTLLSGKGYAALATGAVR
ncbi:MAG: complex I subunit 5 family protein [Endomicrobiales bacterium]